MTQLRVRETGGGRRVTTFSSTWKRDESGRGGLEMRDERKGSENPAVNQGIKSSSCSCNDGTMEQWNDGTSRTNTPVTEHHM